MKYRLTEKIGSGGMAEVFRAVGEGPAAFERAFVIKRIHPRLSGAPEFVRMFVDEAKISARLIHPNIVQVFEFAFQDGGYYLVMEPVDGIDMAWLLRRRTDRPAEQLSPAFVAEVGRQVCRGLDFAHTLTDAAGSPLGIVHRDVTPPNIMVSWNGTVKILDFGLARAAEALRLHQSDAGMVRGKMSYLAPELLDGATADARSDLFSLGVVLHELLSGQRLFVGDTDFDTLKLVQKMEIPRPSSRNSGVKPALDGVVMRALERDPARRYQSAGEMGDELEALVLRKGYSSRALARKVRELIEQDPPADKVRPTPIAAETPPTVGSEDSTVIVDESRHAGVLITGARTRPLSRREPRNSRWRWLALAVPCLLAGGLLGAGLRRDVPSAAVVEAPPPAVARIAASPTATATVPTASSPAPTVRLALDSAPQGATVTSVAGTLGKTPLSLQLPRSQEVVELKLSKPGFAPFQFKVVPLQDKDVLASLQRTPGRPAFASASIAGAPARLPAGAVGGAPPRLAAGAVGGAPPRPSAGAVGAPPRPPAGTAAAPTRSARAVPPPPPREIRR